MRRPCFSFWVLVHSSPDTSIRHYLDLFAPDSADIENLVRVPRKLQKEGRAPPGSETTKKTWFELSACFLLRLAGLFGPLLYNMHGLFIYSLF